MQGIATMLTHKEQALTRSILLTGMPTHGTCLRGIVGIDFDCHTLMKKGFVGNHAMQLRKGPLGVRRVGLPLLLRSFLALLPLGSFSNVCQILKSNQCMWVPFHNLFAD